jgi:hypothetical protein
MFTKESKPDWFRYIRQDDVLKSILDDLKERELGSIEFHGKKVMLVGTESQRSQA